MFVKSTIQEEIKSAITGLYALQLKKAENMLKVNQEGLHEYP